MVHLLLKKVLFRLFNVQVSVGHIHLRICLDAILQALHVHRLANWIFVEVVNPGNLISEFRTADRDMSRFFLLKVIREHFWTWFRWLYGNIHIFIRAIDGEIVNAASNELFGLIYGCCSDNLCSNLLLFDFCFSHRFDLGLSQRLLLFCFFRRHIYQ